jgi:hypothetical protein
MWLSDLGLYHYKARAYSPTLGRFLQTDPSGYRDGLNWYAYVANNPTNALDHNGREISYLVHEVALGVYHSKILINPNNQSAYRNDYRFITNRSGARVATLGAGPERSIGALVGGGGRLVSDVNRPTDVHTKGFLVQILSLPHGMSEDEMITRLFQLDKNYGDDLKYDLFPDSGDAEYNSNSYVRGLLNAAGFPGLKTPPVYAPGTEKPVPTTEFNPTAPKQCTRERESRITIC